MLTGSDMCSVWEVRFRQCVDSASIGALQEHVPPLRVYQAVGQFKWSIFTHQYRYALGFGHVASGMVCFGKEVVSKSGNLVCFKVSLLQEDKMRLTFLEFPQESGAFLRNI